MKYIVDSIIDDIIKAENTESGKFEYLQGYEVIGDVKDGDCLVKKGDFYYLDNEEKEKRVMNITEKLAKIKKYD